LLDADSRVTGFVGRGARAEGSFHFLGVQVVDAGALEPAPAGRPAASIGGVYDQLIRARPGGIQGVVGEAAFDDIGTVSDYLRTVRALEAREGARPAPASTRIDPGARVVSTIVWDEVDVGAGASLEGCIVTDGVRVPPGARYRDMILIRSADGTLAATPITAERG
jgi:NDP-sugar pyrophosphorylase family protein